MAMICKAVNELFVLRKRPGKTHKIWLTRAEVLHRHAVATAITSR